MLPLHAAEKKTQTTLTTFKITKFKKTSHEANQTFSLLFSPSVTFLCPFIFCLSYLSLISLAVFCFFYLLALSLPLFAASILIAHVFASAAPAYWSLTKTHKLVCTNILRYMDVPFPFPNSPKTILLCSPVLSHTLFIHVHVPALPCA